MVTPLLTPVLHGALQLTLLGPLSKEVVLNLLNALTL